MDLRKLGLRPQSQVMADAKAQTVPESKPDAPTESKDNGPSGPAVPVAAPDVAPAPTRPTFRLGALGKVANQLHRPDSPVLRTERQAAVPAPADSSTPADGVESKPKLSSLLTPKAVEKVEEYKAPELDEIPDGPPGFQERLDRLDALIESDKGMGPLVMSASRGYVMTVMKELITHPEYDGMVIARDVHNLMMFVRGSMTEQHKVLAKKKEAAENKATRKAASATFDFSGLDALMIGDGGKAKAAAAVKEGNLNALAALNLDDIETKTRR